MDPDLLPCLVSYYQQAQCTKEIGIKLDLKRQIRIASRLQSKLTQSEVEHNDLSAQIEELKINLAKVQATADVRQREVESLRSRSQDTDKVDRAITQTLKVQTDSYKREIGELRDDLKLRNDELLDLRQDAEERENDLKQARDLTRNRDKEMREIRDQIRARESELRKANNLIEKLQTNVQTLEQDCGETRDALEAAREAQAEAEERYDNLQAQKQIVQPRKQDPVPNAVKSQNLAVKQVRTKERAISPIADAILPDESFASEVPTPIIKRQPKIQPAQDVETDYNDPPSKPTKRASVAVAPRQNTAKVEKPSKPVSKPTKFNANKENMGTGAKGGKKRKAVDDFSASPPRSSPPPESPKRKVKKKPDFSMTPAVDKTSGKSALSLIPLSPPSSKVTFTDVATTSSINEGDAKPIRKKKKLLGGARTLMDDTPKKVPTKAVKTNLGRELSPLKRPTSSGLIIKG